MTEQTLSEELFDIRYIINEADIQKQLTENEGIEFSMTGELIPLERAEGILINFIKKLKKPWIECGCRMCLDEIENLDKLAGSKLTGADLQDKK